MRNKRERGAIVVEATISLTTFMFALYLILSIVDIAYVQYKIAVALNSATKEISQYTCLYYKFKLNELDAKVAEGTEDAKDTANNTIDGIGSVMENIGNVSGSVESGDFDNAINEINAGLDTASETAEALANSIADDPKGFAIGMGKLALNELKEEAKVALGKLLAKGFMKKNLKSTADQDPDTFLKAHGIKDGMKGLSFEYSTLLPNGTNAINLVVTYDVTMVRLLNMDFTFTFRQMSKGLAWGGGVSKLRPANIWTTMSSLDRGQYIVAQERKNFQYSSRGQGFDAYVNSGGKNEFVTITSVDMTMDSYKTQGTLNARLRDEFKALRDGVAQVDEEFTVYDNKLKFNRKVTSDPSTRTYRMVVVIPEGSTEEEKARVKKAIENVKQTYSEYKIEIEVKEDYGAAHQEEKAPAPAEEKKAS